MAAALLQSDPSPARCVKVGGAFYAARTCAQKPSECAQTPWIGAICSTVEFCSSISTGQAYRQQNNNNNNLSIFGHDASLRGRLSSPARGRKHTDHFLLVFGFLFPPRDDVLLCRKALLHDRVSGGQREPPDRGGPHPPDGFELLQPDDRCINERLPGSAGPVPLSDPGPGVPGDGEPPVPHRGPAPARRLPPTASALLRDAAPRPAQLLPVGAAEQVLRTQISR